MLTHKGRTLAVSLRCLTGNCAVPNRWAIRYNSFLSKFTSWEEDVNIKESCQQHHANVLNPINKKFLGPLEKHSDQATPMPMVFVLGNHSSGKSTFINYILKRNVQTAGVAPTDDSFTVIAPGESDIDQDGPAMIGDPDLGFEGLRTYGTALINHVNLKIRSSLDLEDIILVDSPGMIDSPVQFESGGVTNARDRGYNFLGVVRWFAERADVILLFFDPDKPGTTGETLACMTESLLGLDHKVHIILNKVDQFNRVHDFARAYGSLTWNLSKVIPRKDLPRIYTTCIPTANTTTSSSILTDAITDLETARKEIVAEVKKAPHRRTDNMITRLYDSTRLLRVHATVMDTVRKDYSKLWYQWLAISGGAFTLGAVCTGAIAMTGLFEVAIPLGAMTLLGTGGLWWYAKKVLAAREKFFLQEEGLDVAFKHVHHMQLAEQDDFVLALWERVKPQLRNSIRTLGIGALPRLKSTEIAQLDNIIDKEVPALRRKATKAASIGVRKIEEELGLKTESKQLEE